MKIAIVRQKYTPFGGAERFVERALAGLRAQGVEVGVIARSWSGEAGETVRCDPFFLGRTWRDAGFARCVRAVIASGRFDLVQSHERIPGCHIFRAGDGVHATWLELRDRARPVFTRIGTALSPWHRYILRAEAAMFADPALRAVICNSAMVREDIARRFGVDAAKLHVIHNGVDATHFHPGLRDEHRARMRQELGLPADAPVLLFVGSGFERKGVPALLRALALMKHKDARVVIVGKDRDTALMKKLAQTLDIDERALFVGPQTDVRPYYGLADAFCLPTLYDPMPNAALEALACGLPVATTTTCGARELIQPGRNGYLCDALDHDALARHLDALCDGAGAQTRREASRTSIAGLDVEAMAGRLAALYQALARPRA